MTASRAHARVVVRKPPYRAVELGPESWVVECLASASTDRWKALGYATTQADLARLWAAHAGEVATELTDLSVVTREGES